MRGCELESTGSQLGPVARSFGNSNTHSDSTIRWSILAKRTIISSSERAVLPLVQVAQQYDMHELHQHAMRGYHSFVKSLRFLNGFRVKPASAMDRVLRLLQVLLPAHDFVRFSGCGGHCTFTLLN
jgi:hypothetical protein